MEIKIATYNIDGLPESIDLRKLPWPLKPISWFYKTFRGTTLVRVNDNYNKADSAREISRRLAELDADIIAVQEDFNFHNELMENLLFYKSGKHTGGISFDNIRWLPYPRFKADGLNLLRRKGVVVIGEVQMPWEKSHGYFRHANDKLTTKGFRYVPIIVNDTVIDVYVVHMDADFYDPVKCPDASKDVAARKSQFEQLAKEINEWEPHSAPTIVMGDFNSYPKYEWDRANLDYFLSLVRELELAVPENHEDCDHIFVRGLKVKRCYFDMSFGNLSDHKPLIAELEL